MRITTRVTYASIDDFINNANPTTWAGFEYSGPVAELKKGRDNLQGAAARGGQSTQDALNVAKQDNGIQSGYRGQSDKIAGSELNLNGGLSPLVAKQLAGETAGIQKAYQGASQGALKGLAQRGMSVGPSGLSASIINTGNRNAGEAETGATTNAFGTQNQLNNGVMNYDVGQQGLYDPLRALHTANEGVSATSGAGAALNKAGSLMGDIGTGIGTVMGLGGFKGIGKGLSGGGGS